MHDTGRFWPLKMKRGVATGMGPLALGSIYRSFNMGNVAALTSPHSSIHLPLREMILGGRIAVPDGCNPPVQTGTARDPSLI
jgi:hypothetical protein